MTSQSDDERQQRRDAVQEDEAERAMAEAGVVGDDAVEAGEEGGEGVLAEEEDEGDGGADARLRRRKCGVVQSARCGIAGCGGWRA